MFPAKSTFTKLCRKHLAVDSHSETALLSLRGAQRRGSPPVIARPKAVAIHRSPRYARDDRQRHCEERSDAAVPPSLRGRRPWQSMDRRATLAMTGLRHCEERSDAAVHGSPRFCHCERSAAIAMTGIHIQGSTIAVISLSKATSGEASPLKLAVMTAYICS
jgi:hypothetical protein